MTKIPPVVKANLDGSEVISKLPEVVLIDDTQWAHIQKWYSMTQRELQIARFVCQGLSNQQIAGSLKIQQGTVKTHMRNIYRKTWVNNKIAMLLRFVEAANTLSQQNAPSDGQAAPAIPAAATQTQMIS
jgi:DNA-binding NarL/FixJ family response regulator